MQPFTELRIWQRTHRLALDVYRLTNSFPSSERYGIVAQVRRAVVSVSSNIAEGAKRHSRVDYARFLNIAEGSLAETESLLRISRDLTLAGGASLDGLIEESEEIARMLSAMRTAVERGL
jgi:four helix bundle protein